MATATTKTAAGFAIPCAKCGAKPDADNTGLMLILGDMSLECRDCGETVARTDLLAMAAKIDRLLRWLDLATVARTDLLAMAAEIDRLLRWLDLAATA